MASRALRNFVIVGLALALVAVASITGPRPADAATRRFVSGWVPYWSTSASLQSFNANADLFSDLSPFWHSLTSDTTVSDQETPDDRSLVIKAARAAKVPVVPAVTDGTGSGQLAAALADPPRRATVVQTLVNLVVSRGYDGLDLDLEGFAYADPKSTWPTTRPNWVAFVADLGSQLHARGKRLYATIPPTYDSNRANSSGYWVYDYAGIAPHVDRVRLMAYDYSVGSAGPIAPYNWVRKIVTYAQTQIPRSKLVLGVPAYGRDWPIATAGTCPAGTVVKRTSVTSSAAWQLAAAKGAAVQWDAEARERTFAYTDTFTDATTSCTVNRKVYFSDGAAVADRARLVYTSQWAGVAMWTVGGEDGTTWQPLRAVSNGLGYPLFAGQVLEAQVAGGSTGVPADAEAVSLNVTAVSPSGAGYLGVYPCGTAWPRTSNLNYAAGRTIANSVIVGVGSGGKVCVYTSATAHVVVDAVGYFPAGSPFAPQSPVRLTDTRAGTKPAAGEVVAVTVPAGAASALSIAVTQPSAKGWLTVYPCGSPVPNTSTINFAAGQTIAGSALAKPGPGGRVCLRSSAPAHLIVDLMGVFADGSGFASLTPRRLADSRLDPGTQVPANTDFVVTPESGRTAAVLNIAVTGPAASGWLTAYPCGSPLPPTSTINFAAGQTIANSATVGLSGNGSVCLRSTTPTHIVVDRTALFGPGTSYFVPQSPTRVADTRRP